MELIIFIALSLTVIAAAVFAVISRSLPTAIISSGIVSLFASIMFIFLAAPDVAMTEAAIGSGLMTLVFFLVLSRMRRSENG